MPEMGAPPPEPVLEKLEDRLPLRELVRPGGRRTLLAEEAELPGRESFANWRRKPSNTSSSESDAIHAVGPSRSAQRADAERHEDEDLREVLPLSSETRRAPECAQTCLPLNINGRDESRASGAGSRLGYCKG